MNGAASLWSYLSTTPLTWLTVTILAYVAADAAAHRLGNAPWANPVLFAVIFIAPVLWVTNTEYATYFEGAQFIHFLLGPATVALAVPLWDNREMIRRSVAPILIALLVGSLVAAGSAILLALAFAFQKEVILSLAGRIGGRGRNSLFDGSACDPDRHHRCNHRHTTHEFAQNN